MISRAKQKKTVLTLAVCAEVAPEQGNILCELCGAYNCPAVAVLLPAQRAE